MGQHDYTRIFGKEVSDDDIARAKTSFWKKMREVAGHIPFARQVVGLYYMIRDPKVELTIKATGVLAILYFISPIDAIPDFIPVGGFLDDAAVVASALSIIGPLMGPFLKRADKWIDEGKPMKDEPEVVIDVEVKQHATNP